MSGELAEAERRLSRAREALANTEHGADDSAAQAEYSVALMNRNLARTEPHVNLPSPVEPRVWVTAEDWARPFEALAEVKRLRAVEKAAAALVEHYKAMDHADVDALEQLDEQLRALTDALNGDAT